jgi:hypothetical protein
LGLCQVPFLVPFSTCHWVLICSHIKNSCVLFPCCLYISERMNPFGKSLHLLRDTREDSKTPISTNLGISGVTFIHARAIERCHVWFLTDFWQKLPDALDKGVCSQWLEGFIGCFRASCPRPTSRINILSDAQYSAPMKLSGAVFAIIDSRWLFLV